MNATTRGLALSLIVVSLALIQREPASAAIALPAGFSDSLIASLTNPTDLAFTPDGRLLITRQTGQLRVYQNGQLVPGPSVTLVTKICSNSERGLLGVTVDPNFAANHYIYLYYTFKKFGTCPTGSTNNTPVNRVSRFVLNNNNTATGETVIVDNIASIIGNHNGGDLQFGADGYLYISVGDSGTGGNLARELSTLSGKVLRVTRGGFAPPGNPYKTAAGSRRCGDPAGVPGGNGPCREIFALGLRNPFRVAFRPGTSQFYINDVGQDTWEEIDSGANGADYGWNCREGAHPYGACANPPPLTDPIYEYNHNTGCEAITGGVFVPVGVWPAPYSDSYLFADYTCGEIMRLSSSAPYTATGFATGAGAVISMVFGPYQNTQALYYTSYSNGGEVRRIAGP